MHELGNVLFGSRFSISIPDNHNTGVAAGRDKLRALLRIIISDGRLIEFRVHQHYVKWLYVFDFELARLFVDSPHSSHHVIRTCQQASPVIAPVHGAHVGLDLHALRVCRALYVGDLAMSFAELEIRFTPQIPQRRHVEVSPSYKKPLFGVELSRGDFEVLPVSLEPVYSFLWVVLKVFRHFLYKGLLHKHLRTLGACVCVLHHMALELTEFLQLVWVDHGDGLLCLVRLWLVLAKHLLLHVVLVLSLLVSLVHHHLLVKFRLVLLKGCWVIGHHHALELLAPAVERLHVLLLLLGA